TRHASNPGRVRLFSARSGGDGAPRWRGLYRRSGTPPACVPVPRSRHSVPHLRAVCPPPSHTYPLSAQVSEGTGPLSDVFVTIEVREISPRRKSGANREPVGPLAPAEYQAMIPQTEFCGEDITRDKRW